MPSRKIAENAGAVAVMALERIPADYANRDKWSFDVRSCGTTNLSEALRRITEGVALIRSKGEASTGDVSNAVTHIRKITGQIRGVVK